MTGVNRRRGYDASGRRDQARARRRQIVLSATELFERNGFGVTVADIADAADVSPETIYKSFGGKAGLIKVAFDQALAGDDQEVEVADRPETRAVETEPDPRRKLELYVAAAVPRMVRAGRLMLAIRDGARTDPALRELWTTALQQRLFGMTKFAEHLANSGSLRAGVTVEHARDTLWTLIAPELYELLVVMRGWTIPDYRDWMVRAMVAELV
ncbi:TetR/AcrR family transcriptional regulator [Gordonia jacobaea]|uniref:TetR/AcrR family transcriptional regulator n=1 Tax=Gordonia jacobaea TaxID=122202 RepID=UPI003D759F33